MRKFFINAKVITDREALKHDTLCVCARFSAFTSQFLIDIMSLCFLSGQYNLQIENIQLEDDATYNCQAGRSESSEPIISNTAWLNVLSKQNSARNGDGYLYTTRQSSMH